MALQTLVTRVVSLSLIAAVTLTAAGGWSGLSGVGSLVLEASPTPPRSILRGQPVAASFVIYNSSDDAVVISRVDTVCLASVVVTIGGRPVETPFVLAAHERADVATTYSSQDLLERMPVHLWTAVYSGEVRVMSTVVVGVTSEIVVLNRAIEIPVDRSPAVEAFRVEVSTPLSAVVTGVRTSSDSIRATLTTRAAGLHWLEVRLTQDARFGYIGNVVVETSSHYMPEVVLPVYQMATPRDPAER